VSQRRSPDPLNVLAIKDVKDVDERLRRALRRTPAPPRLADSVLARVLEAQDANRHRAPSQAVRTRQPVWRLTAVAASLLLAVASGAYYSHRRSAEVRAAEAAQDLRIALEITSETLNHVQQKLRALGAREF
jgi:anti-sigma-K factor RskA